VEQSLRNALQRATQQLRTLLEKEFVDQLAGIYDIRRDEPISERPGKHLHDGDQLLTRSRLVEAVRHKIATGRNRQQAVDDYVREAAFTTLNRFVALKLLENRGLVQECVSRGDLSSGYKEFTGLAPELALLPDGSGYRLYLECLFDEIGTGVKVLFDRRDPAALLWPRRQALLDLLATLNDPEIKDAWSQDETIGWVYQYFNSEQERRRMRDESDEPRDSHELAVRNQFFTPRYVVEFLSDNTLGRTWYEMRRGETKLAVQCRYLVRRPAENFLDKEQEPPAQEVGDDLSQEELLRQPVYVPHRKKKDPRDLKMLDPACGSGHFLLYCFDLLLTIYEEAWADEQSPASDITGKTLREDYPTPNELRLELPGLILRHSLWGVDIDPRCVQIAAFALWLRSQRAFGEFGIARGERPVIRRTNIVVAEPMPGEKDMLEEFCDKLQPKILGTLVRQLFERMQMAGEVGTLLKIEEQISEAIEATKKDWNRGPTFTQRDLFRATTKPLVQRAFDDDYEGTTEHFWAEVEERIDAALRDFAVHYANGDAFRRTLFADDAEEGFAFIEVCRHRYDVVLMNPPFGETTSRCEGLVKKQYPSSKGNMYIAFVAMALGRTLGHGSVGVISDATFVHQTRYEEFRASLTRSSGHCIRLLAALGWGVLDSYVETAMYVIASGQKWHSVFLDLRKQEEERATLLLESISSLPSGHLCAPCSISSVQTFSRLPHNVLAFWLPGQLLAAYDRFPPISPTCVNARCGLSSSDNPRFYKLWWEVDLNFFGRDRTWVFLANGGSAAPLYRAQTYVVNYKNDGAAIKVRVRNLFGSESRTVINQRYYWRAGFTYGKRTESLTVQYLAKEQVFSNEGQAIFPLSSEHSSQLLAYLNSSVIAFLLNSVAGQHKEAGYVGSIPSPPPSFLGSHDVAQRITDAHAMLLRAMRCIPESQDFVWPFAALESPNGADPFISLVPFYLGNFRML
jgi:predicted RNA methylase